MKNPDTDTMDGNTLLWVTQKACVSQDQLLLQRTTSNIKSVKNMSYQRDFGFFYDQGIIDTSIQKSKYHMFPEVLKSRLRGKY